jgi:hypothetical protein
MSGTADVAQTITEVFGAPSSPATHVAQGIVEVAGASNSPAAHAAQTVLEVAGADPSVAAVVYQLVVELILGMAPNPIMLAARRRFPLSYTGYPPRPPFPGNPYA